MPNEWALVLEIIANGLGLQELTVHDSHSALYSFSFISITCLSTADPMPNTKVDQRACLSCFIMAWYVCSEGDMSSQPDKQKLLLPRMQPQSISGYGSFIQYHWPTDLTLISQSTASFSLHTKEVNYLWRALDMVVSQEGKRDLSEAGGHFGRRDGIPKGDTWSRSTQVSGFHKAGLSQLNDGGMTFQLRWRLCSKHSKSGLQSDHKIDAALW